MYPLVVGSADAQSKPSRRRRFVEWADDVLDQLVGYNMPPVYRAMESEEWSPDDRSEYCARCGSSVGRGEANKTGCADCRGTRPPYQQVVRLGSYAPPLQNWILDVKFKYWSAMGTELGRRIARQLLDADAIDADLAVIVPVPMPWQRQVYRHIDHTRVLADAVCREMKAPCARMLRRKLGPTQVSLTATERMQQGGRGMRIRKRIGGWPIEGLDVVLVDDVLTTGTTMKAAAKLIKPLRPRRIVAAVVAVADEESRRSRAERDGALGGVESRTKLAPPVG